MEIVEEIRQDREKGAKRLESEYKSGLMALARRFCPNESDAEELVNATFATVIENIDSYLEQSAFFGWMCQILTSHHSKNYRRKSNQEIVYPGVLPDVIDEKAQEEIYDHLDATLLRKAIDELPKEQRDAIALHYFMDMSVVQIAKYLAVPNGTVMSRLHYARRALAAKLGAKAENMAKKPGGKTILLALLLCGITALGAAVWNIAAPFSESQPSADAGLSLVASPLSSSAEGRVALVATEEDAGQSTSDIRQAADSNLSTFQPFNFSTDNSQGETMDITTTAKTAATIASASLAFSAAADLPHLDSSLFDYKYEMVALPTAEDLDGSGAVDFTGIKANATWCTTGTGANLGTASMTINGGQNLTSSEANGTAGDVWKNLGATAASGYTIETRLKVTSCTGDNGTLLLNASYGVVNHNAWLQFYDDKITWGSNVITNMDASSWHTYRLVSTNNTYQIFVDGSPVGGSRGNGFGYNTALNRLLFGGSTGYAGSAQVAYLRFHKGAYAPPDPNDKTRCKASTDFPHQYEMTAGDDRFAASGNAKTSGTEWTANVGDKPTVALNGVLSMTPNGKNTAYWATKDVIWKNVVTPETAYTVDFRAKINSCNIDGIDRTLNFMTGTTGPVGSLYVGTNSVSWQVDDSMGHNIVLDTSDNTDKLHIFRIAYSGGGRHAFSIWRDGVKIGENLVDCTNFYAYQGGSALAIVRFGVVSTSTHGGAFDIDYIRWDTTGAWDWKDPPSAFVMAIR